MENKDAFVYIICTLLLVGSILGVFLLYEKEVVTAGHVTLDGTEESPVFVNATRDEAIEALLLAEQSIAKMREQNFSVFFVQDSLLLAQRFFIGEQSRYLEEAISEEDEAVTRTYLESLRSVAASTPAYEIELLNYSETVRLSLVIQDRNDEAYLLYDMLTVLKEKEQNYRDKGVDTTEGLEFIGSAELSFYGEQFTAVRELLSQADAALVMALEEHERGMRIDELSKNFIVRYWWQLLLLLILVGVVSRPLFLKMRKRYGQKKVDAFKAELSSLQKLLITAQEQCFKERIITVESYNIKADVYKKRIAEIKHTLPVYESLARGEKVTLPKKGAFAEE